MSVPKPIARIYLRRLLLWSITILMATFITHASSSQTAHASTSLYTFTVFTNSSQSNMYVYQSNDGLNYYQASAGVAYTPPSGLVRDPSIMHYTDGLYYMTYTTNWTGNTIGIASSSDRINWTFLENVTLPSTIYETWAPEWFIDTDGSVNIIVNLNSTNSGDSNFIPSKITALDSQLSTWSTPTPLAGLSPNYIDTFLVKIGSTYHAFIKNETTKYIEHAIATNLTGPYTFEGTGDWAGWGNNLEGPAIFQLDNGNWRIFMDGYISGSYYYSDSADGFQTWTPKAQLADGLSGFVRHGTVLRETNSNISAGTFNPNSKYKLLNVHSGKALDVVGGSTADGAAVDQWGDNGGANQQWELVSVSGGYFKIISVNSGKALDVFNASTSDGGNIDQWTDNGGANQQWSLTLIGDSNYKLINRHSGKALDVFNASTSDGGSIDQWTDNGGANQQWRLEQVQ